MHCEHAGLFGEQLAGCTGSACAVCGSACDYFCARHISKCSGVGTLFDDVLSCVAACGKWDRGTPADTDGDTLYCRNNYLDAGATLDNCVTKPSTMCVPPPKEEVLCNAVQANCQGQPDVYADVAACVTAYTNAISTGSLKEGNLADPVADATAGFNTFACRLFRSGSLATAPDKATACEVVSLGTGGATSGCYVTPPVDCDTFCTNVMARCTGGNQQYATKAECMTSCPTFELGAIQQQGDTLHCRNDRANDAQTDPANACDDTGVDGGDFCVASCSQFCQDFEDTCFNNDGTDKAKFGWATRAECDSDCATWRQGVRKDTKGNSLSCRAYHLSVAAIIQPGVHCPHASSSGGGVCVDGCEDF